MDSQEDGISGTVLDMGDREIWKMLTAPRRSCSATGSRCRALSSLVASNDGVVHAGLRLGKFGLRGCLGADERACVGGESRVGGWAGAGSSCSEVQRPCIVGRLGVLVRSWI